MSTIQYDPSVVVSRDGRLAVELHEFVGTERVSNRDAVAFTFLVRSTPQGRPFRLSVIFSGPTLSFAQPMESFGLPNDGNRRLQFVHFSEARIGDYLDEQGVPIAPDPSYYATQIECLSDRFQMWEAREPADDDEIEEYLTNRLFWAWKFGQQTVVLEQPDLVRLRITPSSLLRVVELGKDHDWTVVDRQSLAITLSPTQDFLRNERAKRKAAEAVESKPAVRTESAYVDEGRLEQLRGIMHPQYDLTKLIALCDELNACARAGCMFATAMLTRAVIDHVPPIFGATRFSEVASNYPGTKSFKDSMVHLANSARKIGDAHLHVQIRSQEVLPTRTQVDFSRDLDVLLGEIVRILSTRGSTA